MNETDIWMHSDAKVFLTWPSFLQSLRKLEIAFKLKYIFTEKAQFLTLKCSLHLPKDIQREWSVGEPKIRVKSLHFANFCWIKAHQFFTFTIYQKTEQQRTSISKSKKA